jgi:hypothetical protein
MTDVTFSKMTTFTGSGLYYVENTRGDDSLKIWIRSSFACHFLIGKEIDKEANICVIGK